MVDASGLIRSDEAVLAAGGRVSTTNEMADWLIGHLHSGLGNQTYDFPTVPDRVYTITKDMDLPTLHGRDAVTIIVPPGVNVRYTDLGDSKLLFAEDFSKSDKWNGPLAIAPKVLEELSKRDFWAEAFIFAEPDDEANRKAGKTAAARNEQKNDKAQAQQKKQQKGGLMKALFGTSAKNAEATPAKKPEMTAEDWIRVQGLPPDVERSMIASLRQPAPTKPEMTAEDWVRAQGLPAAEERAALQKLKPETPLVTEESWKRYMTTPTDKLTTDPWVEAQLKALDTLERAAPPRREEPPAQGFVKGLLNKAFNLGSARSASPGTPTAATTVTATGPKQKAPAV